MKVKITERGIERVDENRFPKKVTVTHTDSFGTKVTYSWNLPEDIQSYLADCAFRYIN
ncbi:MAG: hypothetical protein J6V90_08155 [Treponema sp.]|nr:hypothetical protein [Treponema sp.]